ncbi:MAG: hypothetical protein ACR2IE_14895 [Candidatus Sumerlaeaceae bacterium]
MQYPGRIIFSIFCVVFLSATFAIWYVNNRNPATAKVAKKRGSVREYKPQEASLPDAFSFELRGGWPTIGKYPRPNWDALLQHIHSRLDENLHAPAIDQAVAIWIGRLLPSLASDYKAYEHHNFVLVTAQNPDEAGRLLHACASTVGELINAFELENSLSRAKLPILLFQTADDYYDYVAYFYPKRAHFAPSGGLFLPSGYPHIAMPYTEVGSVLMTLMHELTHATLDPLDLPSWLEEGIIRTMERKLGRFGSAPMIDERTQRQHVQFWNPKTIQEFWNGSSFSKPDPYSKLSYSLAEILVANLLSINKKAFANFVRGAKQIDGGEAAACLSFQMGLGEVLCRFLGDKDWRPRN